MNESSVSCDDQQLLVLLQRHTGNADPEAILYHVEHCQRCQSRLEELAADAEEWRIAGAVLSASAKTVKDSQDDLEALKRVSRWSEPAAAWTESMSRQLFSPPSHPEMLGRLGRYDIERLIGVGGMGIVFKAFDTELNRSVAIKVLAPHLSGNGAARQRFAREARAAAAVVHEHVVPIHNVETDQASPYLVMQYVAGESLQSRLDRDGSLELCEILRIGRQVASGLAAAHGQGLVHRDIKPSNILLESSLERALITDFGLARAADDASITGTGFHPGTPQYMSPEQAAGDAVDARSDLFSLGSVLYAMCTGRAPFRAETSLAVLRRITDSQPRGIRELNASIPDWFEQLVLKLLEKEADRRFSSAQEVAELLGACLAHVQQPTTNPLPAQLTDSIKSRELVKNRGPEQRPALTRRTLLLGLPIVTLVVGVLVGASWLASRYGNNSTSSSVATDATKTELGNANPLTQHTQRPIKEHRTTHHELAPIGQGGNSSNDSRSPDRPAQRKETREADREGLEWHAGFSPVRLKHSPIEGERLVSVRYIDEWDARYSEAERATFGRLFQAALKSLDRSSPDQFEQSIHRIISTTEDLPPSYRAALMFNLMMESHEWLGREQYSHVGFDGSPFERIKHQCAMAGLADVDKIPVGLAIRLLEFASWSQLTMNTDNLPDWPAQRQLKAKLWLLQVDRVRRVIDPNWDESDLPEIFNGVEVANDPQLRTEHARRLEAERKKAERYREQLLARRLLAEISPRMEEDLIRFYSRKPFNATQLDELLHQYSTDVAQRERIAKTARLLNTLVPGGMQLKYGWPDDLALAGKAGVPLLIEAVRDKSYPAYIRFDGAWALGLIGDPRALPVLQEMAEDEATPVKYQDIAREFTRVIQEKLATPSAN
jgi:serine/threonine protein kinase